MYVYECPRCGVELRSYVEATMTQPYCVACDSRECGHKAPQPEVYCFRAANPAHKGRRPVRMRTKVRSAA